jgi:hypothetical protein
MNEGTRNVFAYRPQFSAAAVRLLVIWIGPQYAPVPQSCLPYYITTLAIKKILLPTGIIVVTR